MFSGIDFFCIRANNHNNDIDDSITQRTGMDNIPETNSVWQTTEITNSRKE